MKKIIALILATIMVMFAVAACGGTEPAGTTAKPNTPDNGTSASTTEATTTEPAPVIPDPVKMVVYCAMGEEALAINIATNEPAGKLKAGEGVAVVQGNFYVAEYYNGESTALADLGAAFKTTGLSLGLTNRRSETNPKNPGKINGGSWWKTVGKQNFDMNIYMDTVAMNTAMGEYKDDLGEFGTLTVVKVENGEIIFNSSVDGELLASEINVKFAYITADGVAIKTATNTQAKTPIANQTDIIRYAIDIGNGKEAGYFAGVWQSYLDNYGAPGSTTKCQCELCAGAKSLQDHYQNEWFAATIPVKYKSALTNYGYIALDANELQAVLAAKDAELAAATKAFNDAVAAHATVKPLKDAMDAAKATYDELHNADSKDEQQATKDAKAAYDAAKKAYDDAVAADAALKALLDAQTAATTAQKTATTNYNNAVKGDDNAEAYTEALATWTAIYAKYCAAYEEAANLILWDKENVAESYLYKTYAGVAEDQLVAPTYTYFYDVATDTYTVYVTSATDANIRVSW